MPKKKRDPKTGTGKKPKGTGRRLYTDENPKDTITIKFKTAADARQTVAKVKRIKKPFARKIQILTVLEQRAKVAGKTQQAKIAKQGKEAIRKKHGTKKVAKKSSETGERYLPEKAIKALSPAEYAASTRKKREDTKKGKQFSRQSKKTARKVRKYRRVN